MTVLRGRNSRRRSSESMHELFCIIAGMSYNDSGRDWQIKRRIVRFSRGTRQQSLLLLPLMLNTINLRYDRESIFFVNSLLFGHAC